VIVRLRAIAGAPGGPMRIALASVFVISAGLQLVPPIVQPLLLGSHAVVYTEAAAAWLGGADPWSVGPPIVRFAGPPTMLLPFLPWTLLPPIAIRVGWIVADLAVAWLVLRRLRLPSFWLAFPPLVSAIVLGHPEVVVLGLLLVRGPVGGLAAMVKPYAALPLVAERRWTALGVAAVVVLATFPILPWSRFMAELPAIAETLRRQAVGDSVFGQPVGMVVAAAALLVLGPRRALWLATPLLWPSAQPIYKVLSIPALSPLIAICWAIPVPGMTLVGVILEAGVVLLARRTTLPGWLVAATRSPLDHGDGAADAGSRAALRTQAAAT
jgi:hypothetical protein